MKNAHLSISTNSNWIFKSSIVTLIINSTEVEISAVDHF